MTDKTKNIIGWIAQVLMIAGFAFFALGKLTGNPEVVANFERWGYPDGFVYLIGVVEAIGALLLIVPRTAGYGALLLIGTMVGAVGTHLMNGEAAYIGMPLIFTLILAVVFWIRKPAFLQKRSA